MTVMEIEIEFYLLLAAISLSLAALASLISLFRSAESYNSGDIYIFRSLILSSFFLLFGCVLPILFYQLEFLSETAQIVILNLLFTVSLAYLLGRDIHKIVSGKLKVIHKTMAIVFILGSILFIVLGIINIAFLQENYIYKIDLVWATFIISARLYLLFIAATRSRLQDIKQ